MLVLVRSNAVVENLEMQRAPQPSLDGVYFITPSEDSVKRVVEDCKQSLYRKAHVFFTSAAPKAVLSLISSNRACVEKLNNCSELNMEYLSVDTKGFSLEIDDALRGTFALGQEASQAQARMMDMIARRLATVMVSLGEIPSVRHMAKIGNKRSDVSRGVAERLDRILTAMLRSKGAEAAKNNPTCDVLVVDRSFDIIAPIIHEWTYESMVTDLLDVPNGVYKYKIQTKNGEEAKEALLGESDPLWVELRHAHIAEVLTSLADKTKMFANIGQSGVGSRDLTTGQLKKAVEALPKVLDQRAKLSVHTSIAGEINEVLQRCALGEVGRVEQDVVFGEATSKDLIALFMDLDSKGIRLPMVEKLRLLLCYCGSHPQKLDESEKKRWSATTGLTRADVDVLENLELLGFKVRKDAASSSSFFSSSSTKSMRPKVLERTGEGSDWDLFRFLPNVAGLVTDLDSGALDANEYPPIGGASTGAASSSASASLTSPTKSKSVRTRTTASWATHGSAGSLGSSDGNAPGDGNAGVRHTRTDSTSSQSVSRRSNRRLIVFVVGGMTRGELREAHALSKKLHREVIVGSTSLETPASFVEKLASLGSNHLAEIEGL